MKKEKKLKPSGVNLIFAIIALILLVITYIVTFCVDGNKQIIGSITYNKSASLSASVCLKDNEFIKGACYDENKSYVTAMIDHLHLKLKLDVQASNIVNYGYDYNIAVRVVANEKGDETKIVYDKTDIIESEEFGDIISNSLYFEKEFEFDYNKYNRIINEFKKQYVLALDSYMIISFNAQGEADYADIKDEMQVKINLSLKIPLAEQTITIDKSNSSIHREDTNVKLSNYGDYNISAFATNVIYEIDILYLALIIILSISKIHFKKPKYERKLKKILREYDRVITKSKNMPDLSDLKIIEIESFEELLDVKESVLEPIICWKNDKKEETKFIILDHKLAYIYVFTSESIKRKKNEKL